MSNTSQKLSINKETYKELKAEYELAKKDKLKEIKYNGVKLDVGYLGYLLKFMKGQLKIK
jgi:hypothetical protein